MLVGGDGQPAEVNTGVEICVVNKVRQMSGITQPLS